ncbi:MAG: M15 family metallopeptidase [Leadbetterella sp.]
MKITNIYSTIGLCLYFLLFSCSKKPEKKEDKIEEKPIQIKKSISEIEKKMIDQGLVNILDVYKDIRIELKYSTTDNFFKQDVYGDLENAYMQKTPAEGLKKAAIYLKILDPKYQLVVYDAARPLSAQHVLWNALDSIPTKKRKDFVSDPQEGSIHNFGCAVDLSIWDIEANHALDMGTPYDYFGDLAYPSKETKLLQTGLLSEQQIENRKLLRKVMITGGFEPISSEWWHFNFYSRSKSKMLYSIIQ